MILRVVKIQCQEPVWATVFNTETRETEMGEQSSVLYQGTSLLRELYSWWTQICLHSL